MQVSSHILSGRVLALGLGATLAALVGAGVDRSAWAQEPAPSPTSAKIARPDRPREAGRGDPALDQKINQAREELELLELQLATRKAQLQLAEARLAEARRWRDVFKKLFHDGFASEERFIAARDDVLMHEAHVAAEKGAVQEVELRVKQAKRRLDYGEFPSRPQEGRLVSLEQRLDSVERGLDLLQQEVASLKRMFRGQWKMPENVERPPVQRPERP